MIIKTDKYQWSVDPLPGNNEVAVSHGSVIYNTQDRGKGLGQKLHEERLEYIRSCYSYALATVDAANTPQVKIMEKNGWKVLDQFVSACTGNTVLIYGKRVETDLCNARCV